MPRLTSQDYFARHTLLRKLWLTEHFDFSVLRAQEQWDLHKYYQPAEDLTDQQLLDHRRAISRERPSLPHQASKAFSKLLRIINTAATYANGDDRRFRNALHHLAPHSERTQTSKAGKQRTIRVAAVMRPQPYLGKLVIALLEVAREQQAAERAADRRS